MIFRNIRECESCFRTNGSYTALYAAVVLLSLHWALVLYINSSYLEQFVPASTIGILYTVGSAVTMVAFYIVAKVLGRRGNYYVTLLLALLELKVLATMAFTDNVYIAVAVFLVHQAIVPLILFNLDIYMEKMIGNEEQKTGSKRGLFLAVMSLAGAFAPLITGQLIHGDNPNFSYAYLASAALMIPFIFILFRSFRFFKESVYEPVSFLPTFKLFWNDVSLRNVSIVHLLLQLFFSWMVIYTPLYLSNVVGFTWDKIGMILFMGLMAYVVLEYPIGILSDRWIGEKEMMAFGLVILAVTTSWFAFLTTASVAIWMFAMFMTRVGASFVETTTESYFFKHTTGSDPSIISFFRATRPLAYIVGSIIGGIIIAQHSYQFLFILLGILIAVGLFFVIPLRDTR